mgnify:CR=1 FL=1
MFGRRPTVAYPIALALARHGKKVEAVAVLDASNESIAWRTGDELNPRFRTLTGATLYSTTESTVTVNVDGTPRQDPDDTRGRFVFLLDHADTTAAGLYGNDVMAGDNAIVIALAVGTTATMPASALPRYSMRVTGTAKDFSLVSRTDCHSGPAN